MHEHTSTLDLMHRSTTILFDFNGTLSDDETELEAAYSAALLDMHLPEMHPDEYAGLLGRSEPDIACELMRARGRLREDAVELLHRVGRRYAKICRDNPRVSDQSVDLVKHLQASGWRLAIVTGTLRQLIEPVLEERGIIDHFDVILTIEDVEHGKPDPEGFIRAAALIGEQDPEKIIVFEDSPAGVEAARAAGMNVIGIGTASGAEIAFSSVDEVAYLFMQVVQ